MRCKLLLALLQSSIQSICDVQTAIFYAFIELESVPDSLKTGIICPIYKGPGRDSLDINSYRGIKITSVFCKNIRTSISQQTQADIIGEVSSPLEPNRLCKKKA